MGGCAGGEQSADGSGSGGIETSQFAAALARDAGGRLYFYRGGCYHPEGAAFVAQQVKRLLVLMKLASKWTSHKSEEVVKYLTIDAPLLDCRHTMSKSVLVAGWAGFAAYPCHGCRIADRAWIFLCGYSFLRREMI